MGKEQVNALPPWKQHFPGRCSGKEGLNDVGEARLVTDLLCFKDAEKCSKTELNGHPWLSL